MFKRKLTSILIIFAVIPAVILTGSLLIRGKQYYLTSVLVCVLSFVPFFASLERKKLQARELVTLASVVAIAVASRAAFFFVQQVKPTCAIVILAAITFGPEFGFGVGALSMLLSNLIFGQGMWTPFQMLGMALTGYICGALFRRSFNRINIFVTGIVCGLCCFAVYGLIVDTGSVFMLNPSPDLTFALSVYASGVLFNCVHSATTALLVILLGRTVVDRMSRIKTKYQIFSYKEKN